MAGSPLPSMPFTPPRTPGSQRGTSRNLHRYTYAPNIPRPALSTPFTPSPSWTALYHDVPWHHPLQPPPASLTLHARREPRHIPMPATM
jgi:hypothetical protein